MNRVDINVTIRKIDIFPLNRHATTGVIFATGICQVTLQFLLSLHYPLSVTIFCPLK